MPGVRSSILAYLCGFASAALASDANLTWDANTEPELLGYKIYWGNTRGGPYTNSIDVGNVTQHTVAGLSESATFYFAATAYGNVGGVLQESWFSNEVIYQSPPGGAPVPVPVAPTGWRLIAR